MNGKYLRFKLFPFLFILLTAVTGCGTQDKLWKDTSVLEQRMPLLVEKVDIQFTDIKISTDAESEQATFEKVAQEVLCDAGEVEGYEADKEQFWEGIGYLKASLQKEEVAENGALGQVMAIHALLKAYDVSLDASWLELAKTAAARLILPVSEGGLAVWDNEECWFERQPTSKYQSKDLLTQLYCLHLLTLLEEKTEGGEYRETMEAGRLALSRHFERFDSGWGIRKDLTSVEAVRIRFVNPYEEIPMRELVVKSLSVMDPLTGEKIEIEPADAGWENAQEDTAGRGILVNEGGSFLLKVPITWQSPFREEWYDLEIEYWDVGGITNISLQMENSLSADGYQDLSDSTLLFEGEDNWKKWRVPIRPEEMGEKMSLDNLKFACFLLKETPLLQADEKLVHWRGICEEYFHIWSKSDPEIVSAQPPEYGVQTFLLDWQIKDGLLMQRLAGPETVMVDGKWDGISKLGELMCTPYLIAVQAKGPVLLEDNLWERYGITEPTYEGYLWADSRNVLALKQEDALEWLNENKIEIQEGKACVWTSDQDNTYSDITTKAPWASAFFQRHIIEAYLANDDQEMAAVAARAYGYSFEEGGLSSRYWNGGSWFEEVPNETHILNAHLASIVALHETWKATGDTEIERIYREGIDSLIKNVSSYDAGYWTVYDRNPQKELLFQLDWLEGEESPLFDQVLLVNTQTNTAAEVNIGEKNDFETYPRISGTEWTENKEVDGRSVRAITNGYLIHPEACEGGTRQNSYFTIALPEKEFEELFDMPIHKLVIRYKDVAAGKFAVRLRSKNEGNELAFEPLMHAVIDCTGDGEWKTKEILLSSADLGWYMGYEYHSYHATELAKIAEYENNWYLRQYARKWQYDYQMWQQERAVIDSTQVPTFREVSSEVTEANAEGIAPGYGIENCLDGDWTDDYTAFDYDGLPQSFTLNLKEPVSLSYIHLLWESDSNYAVNYRIDGVLADGKTVRLAQEENRTGRDQLVKCETDRQVTQVKVTVMDMSAEQRILLRLIRLYSQVDPEAEV